MSEIVSSYPRQLRLWARSLTDDKILEQLDRELQSPEQIQALRDEAQFRALTVTDLPR